MHSKALPPVTVSIIVPAYNSAATLAQCLGAIRNSNYKQFELIVIDDGSLDDTVRIAKEYADEVVMHQKNLGRSYARNSGIRIAKGEILVFIDSDIVIKPNSLSTIDDYFSKHSEIDALTGLLSREHPNQDFFSQYKNLYMNYIFSKLPERINFLFGSICAMRRQSLTRYNREFRVAEDTALGQRMINKGKKISLLKDLEVIHLKKYDFLSWVRNDFKIPHDWAKIFIMNKGWKQLFKNKTGYMHSPKKQLASVVLAPAILLFAILSIASSVFHILAVLMTVIWVFLNFNFFIFLARFKNGFFSMISVPVTFFDHLVMALGILCGLNQTLYEGWRRQLRTEYFLAHIKTKP